MTYGFSISCVLPQKGHVNLQSVVPGGARVGHSPWVLNYKTLTFIWDLLLGSYIIFPIKIYNYAVHCCSNRKIAQKYILGVLQRVGSFFGECYYWNIMIECSLLRRQHLFCWIGTLVRQEELREVQRGPRGYCVLGVGGLQLQWVLGMPLASLNWLEQPHRADTQQVLWACAWAGSLVSSGLFPTSHSISLSHLPWAPDKISKENFTFPPFPPFCFPNPRCITIWVNVKSQYLKLLVFL